jgi:hypothetical protein
MNIATTPTRRNLAHGEILRLPHGAGTTIACQRGSVWITEEADARDQVLDDGEAATLSRPGTALVYALEPSTVSLLRHAGPRPAADLPEPGPFGAQFSEWLASRWTSPLHAFARWS